MMLVIVAQLLLLLHLTDAFHVQTIPRLFQRNALRMEADHALIFDCDGVIVETEEMHRLAYNAAFNTFGLLLNDGSPVEWDVAYYDKLQNTVGGGKPKMRYYFNEEVKHWPTSSKPFQPAPTTDAEKEALVDQLQDAKTEFYKKLLGDIAKPRPGVIELMDEAIADPNLKVGICSAATKAGFVKVVDTLVGEERLNKLDVVMAGDDVTEKKPHPMIYNKAQEILGVPAEKCVVIEDSLVGLRAARSANMRCIITYTDSTAQEDFYGEGADAKVPNLGNIGLKDIFEPLRAGSKEILEGKRDDNTPPTSTTASAVPEKIEVKKSVNKKTSKEEQKEVVIKENVAPDTEAVKEPAAAEEEPKAVPKATKPKITGWTPHLMI